MTLTTGSRPSISGRCPGAGITIEHIAKSHIRKEAVVAEVLKRRGEHPGLVHVISTIEACGAYQPWHDKQTHKTFVRPDNGKCLHYPEPVVGKNYRSHRQKIQEPAPFRWPAPGDFSLP